MKKEVVIQGFFSEDGKACGGRFVPFMVDHLLDSVSGEFSDTNHLYRMHITVEVEDLGESVRYITPEPKPFAAPAQQKAITAGRIVPVPEVV